MTGTPEKQISDPTGGGGTIQSLGKKILLFYVTFFKYGTHVTSSSREARSTLSSREPTWTLSSRKPKSILSSREPPLILSSREPSYRQPFQAGNHHTVNAFKQGTSINSFNLGTTVSSFKYRTRDNNEAGTSNFPINFAQLLLSYYSVPATQLQIFN